MSGIRELTPSRARPQARVEERLAEIERQARDTKAYRVTATPIAQEGWHTIGATGEIGFSTGWSAAGAPFSAPAYFLDPNGIVHLRGALLRTGAVVNVDATYAFMYYSEMFSIALAGRINPSERINLPAIAINLSTNVYSMGIVQVRPDESSVKALVPNNTATSWHIFLDGMSYSVK